MPRQSKTHFREVEKFCPCGKRLFLNNSRDVERKKYCSPFCRNSYTIKNRLKDPAWITKWTEIVKANRFHPDKTHYGKEHPGWKGGPVTKQCLHCGKDFKCKIYRAKAINAGKFCSKQCGHAYHIKHPINTVPLLEMTCELCQAKFYIKPGRVVNKQRRRRFCSPGCASSYNFGRMKKKDTSIEIGLETILKRLGIPYERNKWIPGISCPDFTLSGKILLYADGDYWHSKPEVAARDERINLLLEEQGYRVLRFWECLINDAPEFVEKVIRRTYQCQV